MPKLFHEPLLLGPILLRRKLGCQRFRYLPLFGHHWPRFLLLCQEIGARPATCSCTEKAGVNALSSTSGEAGIPLTAFSFWFLFSGHVEQGRPSASERSDGRS